MKWLSKISHQKWNKELCLIIEKKYNFSITLHMSKINQLKNCLFWIEIFEFVEENTIENFLKNGKLHFKLILMVDGEMLRKSSKKLWIIWVGKMDHQRPFTTIWNNNTSEVHKIGMESEKWLVSNYSHLYYIFERVVSSVVER